MPLAKNRDKQFAAGFSNIDGLSSVDHFSFPATGERQFFSKNSAFGHFREDCCEFPNLFTIAVRSLNDKKFSSFIPGPSSMVMSNLRSITLDNFSLGY